MREEFVDIDWEVITAVGVSVRTFGDEDQARDWVSERKLDMPGLQVVKVTRIVRRESVYKPRLRLVGTAG